jgi:hypothetical protein
VEINVLKGHPASIVNSRNKGSMFLGNAGKQSYDYKHNKPEHNNLNPLRRENFKAYNRAST